MAENTALTESPITAAQRAILTQRTPKEVILYREGPGHKMLAYVEHAWVTEQLNLAFAWAWSWDVLEHRIIGEPPEEVYVLGRLTVHTPKGDLIKSQFGSSAVKRTKNGGIISLGDDLKAASSDALKKAASLLGLALDLYRVTKPAENGHTETPVHEEPKATEEPKAETVPEPADGRWSFSNVKHADVIFQIRKAKLLPDDEAHPQHIVRILNRLVVGPKDALDVVMKCFQTYVELRKQGIDGDEAALRANAAFMGAIVSTNEKEKS